MAAARVTLRELVAQKAGCLNEDEVWCLLSEAAVSLLYTLDADPTSWVDGASLLITPDTFFIGPTGVHFSSGVYSSESEEHALFMAPELMVHQKESLTREQVELVYIFALGMCITASAMLPHEDGLLMKFSEDLRDLLMRMGEEDPSGRDVTLQDVIELYIDYKDTVDEDVELSALLSTDVTDPSHQDTTQDHSLASELVAAEVPPDVPFSPPSPPPTPPPPPSAVLQRVNSLDSIYRHMSVPDPVNQPQKKARLSGMYSRHTSASFDDVSLPSMHPSIPTVSLDTDTPLLFGVESSQRPLSTDSTGIPKILSAAKQYSESGSSSEAEQDQLIESDTSTLSESESTLSEQQHTNQADTLIKFSQQELQSGNSPLLPPRTADTESPPIVRSEEQEQPQIFSNGILDELPELDEHDFPKERTLPLSPARLSQLSSSPSRSEGSPSLRGEDRGRAKRPESDLLTLSQALEAGVGLQGEGHSGTESGDELTPVVRKKRATRRRLSDQEVYVFEPTYDEEWQNLESREESMVKLKKLLGPDFQKLSGVYTPKESPDQSMSQFATKTPVDRRDVEVILLNSRTMIANVDETSLVTDLFQQVIAFLSLQEPENFSLAIIQQGEELFLNPDLPLFKYAPKGWIDRPTDVHIQQRVKRRGRDRRFSVYFRVKFFVENVRLLKSRQTRHLYYLQLKKDLLEGRVSCEEEPALALAGLSLQIEVGDYRQESENDSYYATTDYLHHRVLDSLPADTISDTLKQMHQSHQGLSRTEAELAYLKQAQKLPEYGIVYYRLLWQKKVGCEPIWAGISTRGLVMSQVVDHQKVPVLSLSWKRIKLMWHRNKRFVIQPQDTPSSSPLPAELMLLTNSYKQSKYLLKLSQEFHSYQLLTRVKVAMGAYKGMYDDSSTINLTDPVSFYSSKGSLSTIHSGKSDPYIPFLDTDTSLMPLPAGIDIPEEPGLKLVSITLRQAPGYGFGLTVILNPPERTPGLYIQNIALKGPADTDGRLKLYDQIMSVNSKPITGETYKDILNSLQTSQEIQMIVKTSCQLEEGRFRMETPVIIKRRVAKSDEEFEVRMKRETSQDFGFSVEDTYDANGEMCVTIREITNRDIAGMLEPGDRILEVNSVRLVSLTSAQITTLMEAFTDIHIRLQRDNLSSEKRTPQPEESLSQVSRDYENYPDVTPNTPPPPVPPATPEKYMDPDYIEFETEITKLHDSLGLNINIHLQQSEVSVYVTEVVTGSSADRTGMISPGDQIVSIDSHELTGSGVKETESFLRSLPDGKNFLVKLRRESRSPVTSQDSVHTPISEVEQPEADKTEFMPSPRPNSLSLEQTTTVMILKESTGALGIRLHPVTEPDDTVGIYIKDILKGSPASKAAELHPGAKIVSINSQSLVGVDRQKAVNMLKKATNPILLDIIPDPLMVASELSLSGPGRGLSPPLTHVDTKSTLSHESLPGSSISYQELMAVLDSPDVREEHFSVTLTRGERGLGLKVISKQIDQKGLLVKSILGDPALSNGQLTRGDEITAIDGIDIQNMKREEVFPLIKGEVNSIIKLDVKRYIGVGSTDTPPEADREDLDSPEYLPASLLFTQLSTNSYSRPLPEHNCIEHVFELQLSRGTNQKLGIQIGCLPADHFPTGIFVKNLTENSVASLDGRLSVDDILLETNGIDLRSLDKETALEAIKQSGGEIKFLVARYTPYNASMDVGDEFEVPGPPPPDSAPPPIPLPNQQFNTPPLVEQPPSLDSNTDTLVITHSLDDMIKSLESMEQQVLLPSIPATGTDPKQNTQPNPFLMHKAVQNSAVRIVGPFTQLDFGTYALEDLQNEIKRIHDEMDPESVENDFKEMRARKPNFASSVAKADHNIKKNRSLRAIPYDTNRVVLSSTDPVNDYLNASLVQIKVNELEFKFVCTQAPLPSEVGRFWQMVWEQELYVIVMLVELKEFGVKRTPPYWDESDNLDLKEEDKMDFGNFKVMMIEERCREKMNLRGIHLTNNTTGESRHIMQFNYKQWSGNGFPKSVVDFCNFIDFIRERVGAKEILVHCNNGIGRTGSYCLVDMLSILVKNRVKADLFQLVLTLNSSRMNLIQTGEQYKFGYSALVHLLFERSH